ncbi:MAG: hypothetical protein CL927_09010 [Deltaproteobacteria bacterium]|nr:hypothetical protein [Deltaproteobacteria bacterium]HCH66892.1 hypothetical protein [Deltaproteobacteria bacterium]
MAHDVERSVPGGPETESIVQALAQPHTLADLGLGGPPPADDPSVGPVQGSGAIHSDADVHRAAAQGIQGAVSPLPHLQTIQASFGSHDVSQISAHMGARATEASAAMGAQAYATGNHVVFGSPPDLHTAAHEAAHVVQQRAGVSLKGGVGAVGDRYEQHADRVADAVVAGVSAEPILNEMAGESRQNGVQQQKSNDIGHGTQAGQLETADGVGESVKSPFSGGAGPPASNAAVQGKFVDDENKTLTVSEFDKTVLTPEWKAKLERMSEQQKDYFWRAIEPTNPQQLTVNEIHRFLNGETVRGLSVAQKGDIKGGDVEPNPSLNEDQSKQRIVETLKRLRDNREKIAQMVEERNQNHQDGAEKPYMQGVREHLGQRAQGTSEPAYMQGVREHLGQRGNGMSEAASPAREEQPTAAEQGTTNIGTGELEQLIEAFQKTTFYYGTTGEAFQTWNMFMLKVKKYKDPRTGNHTGVYNAGTRFLAYLRQQKSDQAAGHSGDAQMMDMYYGGQEFEVWHLMRNPVIGKYVHDMMGYAGEYDQSEPPDTTFRKNYPLKAGGKEWGTQGWSANAKPVNQPALNDSADRPSPGPEHADDTLTPEARAALPPVWDTEESATMQISKLIRHAVFQFGGTIVFDGKRVYWEQSFVDGTRKTDTNEEAKAIMPIFANKNSSRVRVGKGTYVFHWGGAEAVPTRAHFLSCWAFGDVVGKEQMETQSVFKQNKAGEAVKQAPSALFWKFPKGATSVMADRQHAENASMDGLFNGNLGLDSSFGKKNEFLVRTKKELMASAAQGSQNVREAMADALRSAGAAAGGSTGNDDGG